jgi:hypothetical protein
VAQLILNDGKASSVPDTVVITTSETILGCGSLLSGTISAAAEVDQLTFSGQAGQRVTLTLVLTDGFFARTATATVFSPTRVEVIRFNANSQQQLTLGETGTYIIQIRASDLVATGSYNIGLECLQPLAPIDATLGCGALLSGTLETPGEVDQITFAGQADQRVTLTMVLTSGFFARTATATVFSPTRATVITFNANSQHQLTLEETGTYVIQIRASDLVAIGGYTVGLECLQPLNPVDGTLACGGLLPGALDAAAEVDQITFTGQANQRVTLTMVLTSGFFARTATATVFSPTRATVITFNANSQHQLTLPETGTYVIQIRASDLVAIGGYTVGLECLQPLNPVDGTLACGGLLSGALDAAAEVDQITFTVQANQRVTLTMVLTSGFFARTATATIFSPARAEVLTFNANSQHQLTLAEAGTYVIQIRASDLVAIGGYRIGMECLQPLNPVDGTLACGGLLSGALDAAAEIDQITFTGQANQRVTLTMVLTGGFFARTATATIFSPARAEVLTFNANSQQQLTLTEAGTYVIQIRASDLVATGTYNIGLECLQPLSPVDGTIACGGLLSGALDAPAEVDQVTFTGQVNQRVTLTMVLTSGFFARTATATVFSPTRATVITFNANSQHQLMLEETGTYIIQIRASDLVAIGGYTVGLECLQPLNPVDGTLACGGLFSGALEAAAEIDQVTFQGQADQPVTLSVALTGGFFARTATLTVFSPTRAQVITFNANSQQQLTLLETGTYVTQIRASDLVATGSYNLGLQCP